MRHKWGQDSEGPLEAARRSAKLAQDTLILAGSGQSSGGHAQQPEALRREGQETSTP